MRLLASCCARGALRAPPVLQRVLPLPFEAPPSAHPLCKSSSGWTSTAGAMNGILTPIKLMRWLAFSVPFLQIQQRLDEYCKRHRSELDDGGTSVTYRRVCLVMCIVKRASIGVLSR